MKTHYLIGAVLWATLLGVGCDKTPPPEPEPSGPTPYEITVPDHFPTPFIPEDNPLTVEKIALGKKLFFDPILSVDSTISCASCHFPQYGFSDTVQFSKGVEDKLGLRNAMPLINLVYSTSFFWDGANPSLEEQAIHPIINELEMASKPEWFVPKLENHPEYPELFQKAMDAPPSAKTVVDAIASYERILVSTNSPYDRYLAGDTSALSPSAKKGLTIFESEQGECFHCHVGYNLTDGSFQNNGLYYAYGDLGRMEITGSIFDEGKFKVPTLRNIEHTAPYMHDGSLKTLEEVMDHYGSGGKPHPNRNIFVGNISLNEQEKQDIIAFMKSLSDDEFLNNPEFRP